MNFSFIIMLLKLFSFLILLKSILDWFIDTRSSNRSLPIMSIFVSYLYITILHILDIILTFNRVHVKCLIEVYNILIFPLDRPDYLIPNL